MACPYFQPVTRFKAGAWDPAPRLPLGDAWSGVCLALASSFEPSESVQHELCNCGYARSRCAYFPHDGSADAVRFSREPESQKLLYILEKDHAPLAFGEFLEAEHGAAMVAQAKAFLRPR